MGRTCRKRRRKTRNFQKCDNEKDSVQLNTWLAENGVSRNNKLCLAYFEETGRGVLTSKNILPGEELIQLPLNLTINVTTILMDVDFCDMFHLNDYLVRFKQKISFQSLMAFYLTYLKIQGEQSKWYVYLKSLPKEYTVSYFLSNEIKCYIEKDILAVLTKQNEIISTSFNIFSNILLNYSKSNKFILDLKSGFNSELYEWAYFTVNTRCVYMDLSKIVDLRNVENSLLNLINDNTKISLCPYLDMINHSANAKNETKLVISKNIDVVSLSNLKKELFSDVYFSIYTKNNFDAYTQVFICYGDSHNLKLITEYGFFLPNNDLDHVSFSFEDVLEYFITRSKLSQDQMSFISSHNLNKDLYIDSRGLSFNFYGLLMVVNYYYNNSIDVSRLIYSAAICSHDNNLNKLILPLVSVKLASIKESICKLQMYGGDCAILNNCVALMCQYVSIMENFIKC